MTVASQGDAIGCLLGALAIEETHFSYSLAQLGYSCVVLRLNDKVFSEATDLTAGSQAYGGRRVFQEVAMEDEPN